MTPRTDEERRERELLRKFFRQVHADDRPPSFTAVAESRRPARRPIGRQPAVAVATVLLVATAVAWLMPSLSGPGAGTLTEEEQLALARELSGWQGPLDFLLDTPGREVLFAAPSLELTILTLVPPAVVPPEGGEETQP